jgi:PAT family beta-lactamase induction signal transducer AmpG
MKRKLPPWVLGLAFTPMGFYYGFVTTALPILMTGHGATLGEVATVSAVAFSPTWWGFALSPILEIWLSRKQWSVLWVLVAAASLFAAICWIGNTALVTWLLLLGCEAIVLFGAALGAWIADVVEDENRNGLGASMNVANLGAAGSFGALAVFLIRGVKLPVAAGILAALLVLPMLLLVLFPDAAALPRTVGEVFGKFWHDLKLVWGRREVMLGMLAFLLPESCFALTNLFSGLGTDFHIPEGTVASLCGVGVAISCSLGCLVGAPLCSRFSRRRIYLATGIVGAIFTAGLIASAHTFMAFAVGVLGYNFVQGINYTAFGAWQFELVGSNNPQGALQFAVFAAAANLPITYMTKLEGMGHDRWGVNGMFTLDAVASVVMGVVLLMVFSRIDARYRARTEMAA